MATRDAVSTSVTGLVAGSYTYILEVTDNSGLKAYSGITITVNASATGQPIGYIRMSVGPTQACADASSAGRIPIYSNGIANGNLVYLDAAYTSIFNGGWNWFSFTPTLGGAVTQAFAIYPNGGIALLTNCSSSSGTPATTSNLLGYIKMSVGAYQACADASSAGRIAIYGTSIANGSYVYSDAALTQKYDGGWNWFSFTPVLWIPANYAFAIYPSGSIGLLRNCITGAAARVAANSTTTSVEQDEAALKSLKDSAAAASVGIKENKLTMYPNPVQTTATIELTSTDNSIKTINLYNANGVLKAKYTWQTIKGNNTFSLKNVSGLSSGLYIIDIRDSNGKPNGKLKFIKM
jgi:hypothetical protein